MLKAMGANGLRTSHNPPAPELLELADRMGFIVMDEAFDMWRQEKTKFDYHLDWDQWHKRDLEDMLLRDRNHPSVFIWSIGNEINEQWNGNPEAGRIGTELSDIVHSLDKTRPITSACNFVSERNTLITAGGLDLVGTNYEHNKIPQFQKMFPGRPIIGTETTSALATRGSYDMPSDLIRRWPTRWDRQLQRALGLDARRDLENRQEISFLFRHVHLDGLGLYRRADSLSVAGDQLVFRHHRPRGLSERCVLHVPERVDHQAGAPPASALELETRRQR